MSPIFTVIVIVLVDNNCIRTVNFSNISAWASSAPLYDVFITSGSPSAFASTVPYSNLFTRDLRPKALTCTFCDSPPGQSMLSSSLITSFQSGDNFVHGEVSKPHALPRSIRNTTSSISSSFRHIKKTLISSEKHSMSWARMSRLGISTMFVWRWRNGRSAVSRKQCN